MKFARPWRQAVTAIVLAGLFAAQTPAAINAPSHHDVVLSDGVLPGQLVNAAGAPQAGRTIQWTRADGGRTEVVTAEDGTFRLEASPGVHRLQVDESIVTLRVWSRQAAPPAAQPAILVVADGEVNRGQFLNNRRVILLGGVVVAAAIVIPLAVDHGGSSVINENDPGDGS